MTRFARARGAAASNERVEEEATPWHQMVSQMPSMTTYQSGGNNRDVEDLDGDVAVSDDAEEFLDDSSFKHKDNGLGTKDESSSSEESDHDVDDGSANTPSIPAGPTAVLKELETIETKKKRPRKQNKCLNCKQKGHLKRDCPDLPEARRKELQELVEMKIERKGKGTGRKKNKRKNNPDENVDGNSPPSNKKQKFNEASENRALSNKGTKTSENRSNNVRDKNNRSLKDITGQTVGEGEGLFQGFRVKKHDVMRLQKLQKQLKGDKSLNVEEINATLKRERRKAERDLAKFIKMVCFNCRKPGHLLVDCPETALSSNETKSMKGPKSNSHCFKCGDANHTSKECVSKLKGADAYQFATCFICKQVGHLAKSCPDNPKGMYPKGGGCKFCGSVEHLKSDCTRKAEKDKRQEVRLNTIRNKTLGIEEVEAPKVKSTNKLSVKAPKVVAF